MFAEAWHETRAALPGWLRCGRFTLDYRRRTLVMGVLNVTPDSFSDGGAFLDPDAACRQGEVLAAAGADILDIGGESSRPGGAGAVDAETEIRRVLPVIAALAQRLDVPLSVDTSKPEVARRAFDAGATILNDITGLAAGPHLAELARRADAALIVMHLRGTAQTHATDTAYTDLAEAVTAHLNTAAGLARQSGVGMDQLVVDPGVGFSKTPEQSVAVFGLLPALAALGYPVLVGPSRKSFLGAITGLPVDQRDWPTAAAVTAAVLGGAQLVRVHNVAALAPVVRVADALARGTLT